MKLKKNIIGTFTVLMMSFSVVSCVGVNANTITVESGEIPPDMATDASTLIAVIKDRSSYDKYVKSAFENYSGKYILATEQEVKTKYSDVNVYRYVMDYERESGSVSEIGTGKSYSVPGKRFFIIDRKTDKIYKRKSWSSFYGKELKAYVSAINKL
ncbi:hypothetical protein [Amniculibacterium aquaticum]|jgi:hypothetical protein|uniref:hypothetical protein n=1 Tax=Amniculibacterium aquaticum TaxID=2479858 RepID=UPI000F5B2A6A|nr:hypothetical protein [Amniculibacterium aquaticum]